MQLADLYQGLKFFQETAKSTKLVQKYNQFNAAVEQTHRNRQAQTIEPQLIALRDTLQAISLSSLHSGQKKALASIGALEFIGPDAWDAIDSILRDENFDPVGVADKIKARFDGVSTAMQRVDALIPQLAPFEEHLDYEDIYEGEGFIEISFLHKTSVDNIADFHKWTTSWTTVFRHLSKTMGKASEDCRILSIQKHSPMLMEIAADVSYIVVIGVVVDRTLHYAERVLKLKKLYHEAEQEKLKSSILKGIKEEISDNRKAAEKEALSLVQKELKAICGDIIEGQDSLKTAISTIFDFCEKGGTVDFYEPVEEGQESSDGDDVKAGKKEGKINQLSRSVRAKIQEIEQIRCLGYDFDDCCSENPDQEAGKTDQK